MISESPDISSTNSLKASIFETLSNTKLKSVSSFLKNRNDKLHFYKPRSLHPSDLKQSCRSQITHTQISPSKLAFSPSFTHSHNHKANHSSDTLLRNLIISPKKKFEIRKKQLLEWAQIQIKLLQEKNKLRKDNKIKRKSKKSSKSKSKSKSKEKESQLLNLSSIVEQQSSESKLKTPKSKDSHSKSQSRHKRKYEGERTTKKQRKGLQQIVWKRLDKSLREPQKFIKIINNQFIVIKIRILRKKLIQINISILLSLEFLSLTLHKGNLQCQGIKETFYNAESQNIFSLFSSVRAVDLNDPFRLPQLQLQIVSKEIKVQKLVTLPFCWLHTVDQTIKQVNKSRMKTKVCIQQMKCSHNGLKNLMKYLPGWNGQMISKGFWIWSSQWSIDVAQYELRIVEKDNRFTGQITGRGEDRLTRMLQFIQNLIN